MESLRRNFFNGIKMVIEILLGSNGLSQVLSNAFNSTWSTIINKVNSLKDKGVDLISYYKIKVGKDEAFLSKLEVPTRWIKSIPIKVNVFAWKVFLDRIPTRSNLARRNISIPSLACSLCDHALQDSSHLFFGCFMVKDVQKLICRWWNLDSQFSIRMMGGYLDDDITDDEDALPHDLADSNNEDLINVDDDGKGKRKPNSGGRAAGRLNTRDKTRNLSLKEIRDTKGPGDDGGGEDRPLHTMYPAVAWVALLTETQFDLRPHMESPDWTKINAGIQQHLQKAYNTNKAAFKAQHWVINPTIGTYNVEKIRRERLENITASEWDKYIEFWSDPRNIARAAQNRQNQAKSTVISRQESRSLARLRDEMRQSSTTQEYLSLIDTFFVAHTVNGEFLWDEDQRIYEDMRRLEATGTYNDDEINRLARGGKQRGHIPGVGRVLPARATASPSTPAHESTLNSLHKKVDFMMSLFKSDSKYSDMFSQFESGGASGSGGCGDDEEGADHHDEDEDGDGDTYLCYIYESLVSVPQRTFPGDKSPGKRIPSDKSPRKAGNSRWGRGLML
nr:RNA-directed DNA polymerase, eukaryota [Tanacetum cinerariifolium]